MKAAISALAAHPTDGSPAECEKCPKPSASHLANSTSKILDFHTRRESDP
jgi:hypothetical protein